MPDSYSLPLEEDPLQQENTHPQESKRPHLWIVKEDEEEIEYHSDAELPTLPQESQETENALPRKRYKYGRDWFLNARDYFQTAFRETLTDNTSAEQVKLNTGAMHSIHFKKSKTPNSIGSFEDFFADVPEGFAGVYEKSAIRNGRVEHAFRIRIRQLLYKQIQTPDITVSRNGSRPGMEHTMFLPAENAPLSNTNAENTSETQEEITIWHSDGRFVYPEYNTEMFRYAIRHKVEEMLIWVPSDAITDSGKQEDLLKNTQYNKVVTRPQNAPVVSLPIDPALQAFDTIVASKRSFRHEEYIQLPGGKALAPLAENKARVIVPVIVKTFVDNLKSVLFGRNL